MESVELFNKVNTSVFKWSIPPEVLFSDSVALNIEAKFLLSSNQI